MARKHLFIIHGWGEHPADTWAEPYSEAILSNLKKYSPFKGKSAKVLEKDWIKIIPLNYDSVFNGYRTRWKNLAGALTDQPGLGNATVRRIVKWVADSGDKKLERIFWDYILDAVLWLTLPEARKAVVAKVNAQLAESYAALFAESGGQPNASIIAHSMGTSVIHDSLVCLQNSELTTKNLPPGSLKFVSVSMVANVSRLLQSPFRLGNSVGPDQLKVYNSQLLPGRPDSLSFAYLNYHHRADPLTWPKRFDLVWSREGDYRDTELVHYKDLKAVHNFDTHMNNPRVHVTMFRRIFGDSTLFGPAERDPVIAKFHSEYPRQASDEFNNFRALFNNDQDFDLSALETAKFLIKVLKELK